MLRFPRKASMSRGAILGAWSPESIALWILAGFITAAILVLSGRGGTFLGYVLLAAGVIGVGVGLVSLSRRDPFYLLAMAIPVKAFVDQFWWYHVTVGGTEINANMLTATIIPTFLLFLGLGEVLWRRQPLPGAWGSALYAGEGLWVALARGTNKVAALLDWWRPVASLPMLVFSGLLVSTREKVEKLLIALAVIPLVLLPGIVVSVVFGEGYHRSLSEKYYVLTGPFHDKHALAGYLMAGLVAGLVLEWYYRGQNRRSWLVRSVIVVTPPLLFLTNSRATLIAAAAYAILLAFRQRRWGVVMALMAAVVGLWQPLSHRFEDAGVDLESFQMTEHVMDGRLFIWNEVLDKYRQAPLDRKLFGLGFGESEVYILSAARLLRHNAHNTLLMLLVEQGVVGMVLYVGLFMSMCTWLWRGMGLAREDRLFAAVREGAVGLLVFFVANGVTGHSHKFPVFAWPMYVLLSVGYHYWMRDR